MDRGSENTNKIIKKLFKDKKMKHIFGYELNKASFAECAIHTMNNKLYRYLQTFWE